MTTMHQFLSEFRLVAHEAVNITPSVLAVHVTGSVARASANRLTSDIDVLIAVDDDCPHVELRALADILGRSALPIDAVVIRHTNLVQIAYPTTVEVLIKPIGPAVWPNAPKHDALLAIQDAAECGLWVCGSEQDYRIVPVPWNVLRRSIDYLLPFLGTQFKNPSLSLCRAAYSYRRHRLCSKMDAGTWALTEMEQKFHEMIVGDLSSYRTGSPYECSKELLGDLEREVRRIGNY